ncbi:MAG: DMT family transporter [Acidimicrobiia bacterium]
MTDHQPGFRAGLVAVAAAVAAWGVTGVLIKSIEMDAIAIAAWRFMLYAALLTVWLYARGGRLSIRLLRASFLGGAFLAGDVMLFFTAVQLTNIVNATTIGAMQPIVIAVFATRVLGERIHRREYASAAVAIAGVTVVITQSSGTPEWSGVGDLAAVGALLTWSAYFIVAKRTAGTLTPLEFTVGTGWWVAALSFPTGLIVGQDMSAPPVTEFVPLIALLVVGGLLGHSLMNWGIPRVPLWLSSTMTLLIPVFASVAAWVFLGEALTGWQLAAMGVVVGALAVVVAAQSRPTPVLPPQAPVEPLV